MSYTYGRERKIYLINNAKTLESSLNIRVLRSSRCRDIARFW